MRFKAGNTDVVVSFSFFALILLSCVWKNNGVFLISLITSLLHEVVHLLFILVLGADIEMIRFSLMGGEIKRGKKAIGNISEALISLSAPIVNIIIGIILLTINTHSQWGEINLLVGLFNILPYETFDGGRGIQYLLKGSFSEKTINKIIFVASFGVCFFFLVINGYMIKNNRNNVFFLGMSVYLLILLVFKLFCSSDNQLDNL